MKYIIDIDDDLAFDPQFIQLVGAECTGTVRIRHIEFDMLEELTSDYVSENFCESQDAVYQRGLNDAWEAARKIVCAPQEEGLGRKMLDTIFGDELGRSEIMFTYSAQEAIAKLKAYEQKQTKRDIGNDIDYLMQSTGMTVEEIAQGLLKMRN